MEDLREQVSPCQVMGPHTHQTHSPPSTTSERELRQQRRQQRAEETTCINTLLQNCAILINEATTPPCTTPKNNMTNNDTPKLPKLSYNNFAFWKSTLAINATIIESEDLLTIENPQPPIDPAAALLNRKKLNKLKALIVQSIPEDIVMKLPQNFLDGRPKAICNAIATHVSTNNMKNHDVLEAEARRILFLPDEDLDEYVKQHETVRCKMLNAGYPIITEEKTTVKVMVHGLRKHPDFMNLAIVLSDNLPDSIRAFANHIRRALLLQQDMGMSPAGPSYQQPQQQSPTINPYQNMYPTQKNMYHTPRNNYRPAFPNQDLNCPRPANWKGM